MGACARHHDGGDRDDVLELGAELNLSLANDNAPGQIVLSGAPNDLRALREDAGLSQEELAERAGLSPHAISALERGTRTRPYPHTLRALATALDLSEEQRASLLAAVPSRTRAAATTTAGATGTSSTRMPKPITPMIHKMTRSTTLLLSV